MIASRRARQVMHSIVLLTAFFSCQEPANVPAYLSEYREAYHKNPREANLKWFKQAKFGLFIHYGLYSQLEKGEWVQLTDTIPLEEYEQLAQTFDPANFNAEAICDLAIKAGMNYITITSKHHDGFCLFKTDQTDYNSWEAPAHRDLIGELAQACERNGLGLFLYYSYALDWHHPYFLDREGYWHYSRPAYKEKPEAYKFQDKADFDKYIAYVHTQLTELLTQYPTIAGIWLDPIMGYYHSPEMYPIEETYTLIRELSPHALISFKQGASGEEDFAAPERDFNAKRGNEFRVAAIAQEKNAHKFREICNTMQPHVKGIPGQTWGYNKYYNGKHLGKAAVLDILHKANSQGANLLLNVGPLPDGSIHPEDIAVLSSLNNGTQTISTSGSVID